MILDSRELHVKGNAKKKFWTEEGIRCQCAVHGHGVSVIGDAHREDEPHNRGMHVHGHGLDRVN